MNQANREKSNPFDEPSKAELDVDAATENGPATGERRWSTPRSITELAAQREDLNVGHRFTLINDRVLRVDLLPAEAATDAATTDSTATDSTAPDSTDGHQDEASNVVQSPEVALADATQDIWIKTGAMIAYEGEVEFIREGLLEKGVGKMIKKVVTGEGTPLTKATGCGRLYLADAGKRVHLLKLESESLFVRGSALIAMDTDVDWDIGVVPKFSAVVASSLFNVQLHGSGVIAISSHFEPIVLTVSDDRPIFTDPDATIAWSGALTPEYRAALTVQTFLGRGSGEAVQMEFRGNGFVVVQPFEEGMLHA